MQEPNRLLELNNGTDQIPFQLMFETLFLLNKGRHL